MGKTLLQKVWDAHTVRRLPTGQTQLFIGLHLVHEVTSPQAFDMLNARGWTVAFPQRTFATVDHIVPTLERQRPFLDVMAEPRQKARNLAHGRRDFRIDGVAIRRFVGEGDAELARVAADFLRKRPLRWRRHIGARRLGTVDRIHHDSAVAHADAHDMAAGEATPAFAAIGAERIAGPGRLQAEHAGGGSGDPDRAAAIAGMRDGENAGGNRRRRATR